MAATRWRSRSRNRAPDGGLRGALDGAERPCDVDAILPEETCRRLSQVKRSWDPDELIRANHSVALATA
jgi:hypothetical protein